MVLIRQCMSGISYAYWYYDITLLKLTITFSIVLPLDFFFVLCDLYSIRIIMICRVFLLNEYYLYKHNNERACRLVYFIRVLLLTLILISFIYVMKRIAKINHQLWISSNRWVSLVNKSNFKWVCVLININ